VPFPDRVYRTLAVVLRRRDLGEADRILTLYTRDYGKLNAVAKGARKPHSKKAGHVELFTQIDVLLSQGRSLEVVSQVEMQEAFPRIREDLVRATYAAHFAELVDAFTEEGDESRAVYDLLVAGLNWLSDTPDPRRAARFYELHLLDLSGYRFELRECVVGGEPIKPQNQFYSPADGGIICPKCAANRPRVRPISLQALKVLRYFQAQPFDVVEQLSLTPKTHNELEQVLHETITYHLERRLRSAAFLKRLRRELRSGPKST
jgi:DNA repair protein RecO (recombination protein O)